MRIAKRRPKKRLRKKRPGLALAFMLDHLRRHQGWNFNKTKNPWWESHQ